MILYVKLNYLYFLPEITDELLDLHGNDTRKRYKQAKIRKRRNQKKTPTPKTEVGKNQTNNQVLIP